ncbi:hypothetical protein KM043_015921 [Ampulex compressa]|nr:hypothetical protein KM043_015921 [Ampulex compressa]
MLLEKVVVGQDEVRKRKGVKEEKSVATKITERLRKEERRARLERIGNANYNSWYEKIVAEGVPLYLQGKRKRVERRLIARIRCGNEARGNQYWRDMEDRICSVRGKDKEDMDHIVRECMGTKEDWAVEELLKEDGSGWEVMRRIVGIRGAEIEGSREERGKGQVVKGSKV